MLVKGIRMSKMQCKGHGLKKTVLKYIDLWWHSTCWPAMMTESYKNLHHDTTPFSPPSSSWKENGPNLKLEHITYFYFYFVSKLFFSGIHQDQLYTSIIQNDHYRYW
jgi:hypothetical protein